VNQSPIWNFEKKRRNIFDIYIKNNQKLIIYNKKQKAKSPPSSFPSQSNNPLPPSLPLSPKEKAINENHTAKPSQAKPNQAKPKPKKKNKRENGNNSGRAKAKTNMHKREMVKTKGEKMDFESRTFDARNARKRKKTTPTTPKVITKRYKKVPPSSVSTHTHSHTLTHHQPTS